MISYLFDTSVILRTFLPDRLFPNEEIRAKEVQSRIKAHVFPQWVDNEACLVIPNFIVAETLKIIAGIFLGDEKVDISQRISNYDRFKNYFIGWIKYRPILNEQREKGQVNKFFTYELNRHHTLNLDDVFKFDYQTLPIKKNKEDRPIVLSSHDSLLVSVGIELQRTFGNENVFILTLDKRIRDVCMKWRPQLPFSILVDDRSVPESELFPKVAAPEKLIFKR